MVEGKKLRGRFSIANIPSFILMVVFSVLIFLGMTLFSEVYTDIYFQNCQSSILFIVANFAPILLVMLFIYGITAHSPFSIFFTGALFLISGMVNNYKILVRNDPFVLSDLTLVRELAGILKGFDSRLMFLAIALLVAVAVVIFLLLFFFRSAKVKWWQRLIICLCCLIASAGLYFTLYSDSKLYEGFEVEGSIYCKYDQYSSKGWVYCFIYEADSMIIKAPEGYNSKEYKEKTEQDTDGAVESSAVVKPHVIMIMSEAFTDLSENPNLDFSGYRDPLENYKQIAQEAVVSGHVAVDVFAGGTATTEFEVLSGIDADVFNSNVSPYNLIRKSFYALPGIMEDIGYETVAIHPGDGWFYNRDNVYQYMGFDDFLNIGNGIDEDSERKGYYITEAVTYDYLSELLNQHLHGDIQPLFEFCVTIQNHGGYSYKYGELPPNFSTSANLDDNETNLLTNYFHGVIDADIELGEFIDYVDDAEEPVVVVYWGDHYPSLETVYDKIGYGYSSSGGEYTDIDKYFTPFFIWQNEAAAASTPLVENAGAQGLGQEEVFDATFLGSTLLELLGYENMSSFMSYCNEVRDSIPIHTPIGFMDENSQVSQSPPSEFAELYSEYLNWSYYMMFDN